MQQRIDDIANGSLKLLFAVGTDKPCHFVVACRYLIWRASVFAAPHVGCCRALSSQVVDSGNHFQTTTNGTTGAVMHQRVDDIANGRLKLLSAIRTYKDGLFVAACRCFAGRASILVAPHGGCFRAFGSQIVDAGNNLFTCTNRATSVTVHYRTNNTKDFAFKFLPTVWANKCELSSASRSHFTGREGVLVTPHGSSHRAFGSHVIDAGDNFLGIGSVGVDVGVDVGVHSGFHNKLSFSSYFRGL